MYLDDAHAPPQQQWKQRRGLAKAPATRRRRQFDTRPYRELHEWPHQLLIGEALESLVLLPERTLRRVRVDDAQALPRTTHDDRTPRGLLEIAGNPKTHNRDRVAAYRELLDRGWGKPPAFAAIESHDPLELDVIADEIRGIADELRARREAKTRSTE